MADQDLQKMMQSAVNLIGIVDDYKDRDATEVMSGIMRFTDQLADARITVIEQMRSDRDPEVIHATMNKPNAMAAKLHADDFLAVNTRSNRSFADIIGVEGAELSGEAVADIMVWLSVSDQALIAYRLLFQVSRLYGRAPNGKRLPPPPKAE